MAGNYGSGGEWYIRREKELEREIDRLEEELAEARREADEESQEAYEQYCEEQKRCPPIKDNYQECLEAAKEAHRKRWDRIDAICGVNTAVGIIGRATLVATIKFEAVCSAARAAAEGIYAGDKRD